MKLVTGELKLPVTGPYEYSAGLLDRVRERLKKEKAS